MNTLFQYCTPRKYPVLLLLYSIKKKRNKKKARNLLLPARSVAGAEIAPCHKHYGLGSNPVINGVARQ